MLPRLACSCLTLLFCGAAFAQTAKFVIADVHVTPPDLANDFMQANPPNNGRYEFHSASMIDLIQLAYGFDPDRILGGPSWLEMDRFDIIAQAPPGTRETPPPGSRPGALPNAVQEMLQSLLADRFHLAIREETKALPGFALTADKEKKLQLKEADGSGNTGCRNAGPAEPSQTTIPITCRNMTMDAFANLLSRLIGPAFTQVLDKTGLKGAWDFEMNYPRTGFRPGAAGDASPAAVLGKLGLQLEPQSVPTQVAVVERADEKPTANPPGVSQALPIPPEPTAFDVATIKPTDPDYRNTTVSLGAQPGGRWSTRGIPLSALLVRAFSPSFAKRNEDLVVGMPGWAETTRFDITAKNPSEASASSRAGPMVRTLLEERLKLKWHTEERPVNVYVLTAAKPKMKKADPASRTHCLSSLPPAGSPPNSASFTCQNITMDQFAEYIRDRLPGPGSSVVNATGLEGGWDFTVTYLFATRGAANPGAMGAQGTIAEAADPSGGLSVHDAIEKELGLKLETQKRPMKVTVIDHVEQTPVNN